MVAAWAHRYLDAVHEAPTPSAPDAYADDGGSATISGGFTTSLRARGFGLLADEPASVGGGQLGPTPYDFLNLSLASCTAMTLRMFADRKKWPLEEVHVVVTHDRVHADDCEDCEHTEGHIDVLTRTLEMTGDLDDGQRNKLQRIADRCPVHKTLEGQLEVRTVCK